jgi:hypothetical protein
MGRDANEGLPRPADTVAVGDERVRPAPTELARRMSP